MKNKILIYLGLLLIPFLHSCEENDEVVLPKAYESKWMDNATLNFSPVIEGVNAFEYNVEVIAGGKEYWKLTTVDFNVNLELGKFLPSDISKVDLYVFVEEQNDETFNYIGGEKGKLYTSIANPSESHQITLSKDDLTELFANDFSANHNGEVLPTDLFEFKWVITGKDGNVLDTRTDCTGFDCSFGFGTTIVQVAPPIWEGTFNYEWIAATAEAERYGRISVGQTGTIDSTLKPGSYTEYAVSDLSCDYYYGGPGSIQYNFTTGEVRVIDDDPTYTNSKWNITDVSGPTITIEWSYYYSQWYNEYGTFTLTRTDGQDWPTNLFGT